jgi:carbonic anhydrase
VPCSRPGHGAGVVTVRLVLEDLLEANSRYAEGFALAGLPSRASKGIGILTCIDTRIEPLQMLGLQPGDAKILRNAGARVTPDVLRSLALATHFLGVTEIAIVQHTDCALGRRSGADVSAGLREAGVRAEDVEDVEWLAMPDPDAALENDVKALRASALLAPGTRVEGWRYDVTDGSIARLVTS